MHTERLGFGVGNIVSVEPSVFWEEIYVIELYNHSNKTVDENNLKGYEDDMKSGCSDPDNIPLILF